MKELLQPKNGYRFSIDALLLAAFSAEFHPHVWCDLGTGCGVIAVELAKRLPGSVGVAIERQPLLIRCARTNLANWPISLVEGDVRAFPWVASCLDLVSCNPPFYQSGSGRTNKNPNIAEARHAFHGDILAFATAVGPALKADGLFCFIFPFSLATKPLVALISQGWYVASTLEISSFAQKPPNLICVALTKKRGPEKKQHLVLYESHRVYTNAAKRFLQVTV